MSFPEQIETILTQALQVVETHPEHKLLPRYRVAIYEAFRAVYGISVPNHFMGHLGNFVAQKVRGYWDEVMPLWPDDEDEPEPKTRHLATYFLDLLQQVLQGNADMDLIHQVLSNYWYVMGNIEVEIFEWCETDTKLAAASYAINAVFMALHDTFYPTGLERRVRNLGDKTEEVLSSGELDAAGSAILAIVGKGKYEKNPATSNQERLAFWRWWLLEAIPQAKGLAGL